MDIFDQIINGKRILGDEKRDGCPDIDKVVAYANFELENNEKKEVEEHIKNCSWCLKLVLSIRVGKKAKRSSAEVLLREFNDILKKTKLCSNVEIFEFFTEHTGESGDPRELFDFDPIPVAAMDKKHRYVPVNVFKKGKKLGGCAEVIDEVWAGHEFQIAGYFREGIDLNDVKMCFVLGDNLKGYRASVLKLNKHNNFFLIKVGLEEKKEQFKEVMGLTFIC